MTYVTKSQLVEVFHDTERWIQTDERLAAAAEASRAAAAFYAADDRPPLPERRPVPCEVAVTRKRTYQAAMDEMAEHPGRKVAVLNFASAANPGGGVRHGSYAQEESLCRCSTLLPTLDQNRFWDVYYRPNRSAHDPIHKDDCIYSPGIVICKTDESLPARMPSEQWRTVDVITCAAPNLRGDEGNPYNPEVGGNRAMPAVDQYCLHVQRARHILRVAAANGVDSLILGAFGCGAFRNDPMAVAMAYRDVVREYAGYFDRIEFAVFCSHQDTVNYDVFRKVFQFI